jgi:hypothetical protein
VHHLKHDNHRKRCLQDCTHGIDVVKMGRIHAEPMITSNIDSGLEEEVIEKSSRGRRKVVGGHREVVEGSLRSC